MVTLRCTQKLLRRLGVPTKVETYAPTTVLGDWYANLIYARPHQLVLCMNERSLLLVLVPAREGKSLPMRFRDSALALLHRLGVPSCSIETGALAMRDIRLGPTANRRVVGCMREAAFALSFEFESRRFQTVEAIEDYFCEFIYSTTGYRPPGELALELFSLASSPGATVSRMH
jgi:hypothetical protein